MRQLPHQHGHALTSAAAGQLHLLAWRSCSAPVQCACAVEALLLPVICIHRHMCMTNQHYRSSSSDKGKASPPAHTFYCFAYGISEAIVLQRLTICACCALRVFKGEWRLPDVAIKKFMQQV